MGHQSDFFTQAWQHRDRHGGVLRQKRRGRGARPLSTRQSLHVVFKLNRHLLREKSLRGYRSQRVALDLVRKYARMFFVKVEQISIQGDHIHLLIRTSRRSQFLYFFRVVAGQIAQVFEKEGLLTVGTAQRVTDTPTVCGRGTGLWKHRPFSRVVRGWRAYKIVRDYIQLNEQEAKGVIKYQKLRLRGLSSGEWALLWS